MKLNTKLYSTVYSKNTDLSAKEQHLLTKSSSHYQKVKKSSSLSSYETNKERLKKIAQIYRVLSHDKMQLDNSKSRHPSPNQEKKAGAQTTPFATYNLNAYLGNQSKQRKKLTIQRGNHDTTQAHASPEAVGSSWAALSIKCRSTTDRLQQINCLKSEESFLCQLEKCLKLTMQPNSKKDYTGRQEFLNCLKIFSECLQRRQKIKIAQLRNEYIDELTTLRNEVNNKIKRVEMDRLQLERVNRLNCELEEQLIFYRNQAKKIVAEVGCGTNDQKEALMRTCDITNGNTQLFTLTVQDGVPIQHDCNCNEKTEKLNNQLAQCIKKLQALNKRQKELLSVLVALRNEGIDVQRVYDDVINGRIEADQSSNDEISKSISRIRRSDKLSHQKYKHMKVHNSFDADDSILSSADGLSFNYEQKSLVEDVFTVRRQYKCQKEMESQMKQQLKLNFDVLYDESQYANDFVSDEGSSPPAPTC